MAVRRFPRRRDPRSWLAPLGAAVTLLALLWAVGFLWFIADIARDAAPADGAEPHRTDAIVVLTGGSERLVNGLELLAAGTAEKLFVSGVYHGVDVEELLRVSRLAPGELECCITLGYAAESTEGNAIETANWMRSEGFRSLRLVTANYHMRRSLLEFHIAMPEAEVIPHPVVPAHVRLGDWWLWRRTTLLLATEYNKYLIALCRYWLDLPSDA